MTVKQFSLIKKIDKFTEHYELKEEIGRGAFGTVQRGVHRKTGRVCAIKIINNQQLTDDTELDNLMRDELENC